MASLISRARSLTRTLLWLPLLTRATVSSTHRFAGSGAEIVHVGLFAPSRTQLTSIGASILRRSSPAKEGRPLPPPLPRRHRK